MKLKLHKVHDGITPSLARLAVKARNTRLAMRQGGMAAVSLTKRSFGDASLRPATWPPLKASTLAARRRKRRAQLSRAKSGALWRVEDAIHFIKQCYYNLEDIRVLKYRRLKNMVALFWLSSSNLTASGWQDGCVAIS